jgi:hypothetical protein
MCKNVRKKNEISTQINFAILMVKLVLVEEFSILHVSFVAIDLEMLLNDSLKSKER